MVLFILSAEFGNMVLKATATEERTFRKVETVLIHSFIDEQ